jgi:hypothetical protein
MRFAWKRHDIGSRGCAGFWGIRSCTRSSCCSASKARRSRSKLAELTDRSVATISIHLGKLRTADVVRYDTRRKQTRYWLKHKREMKDLLLTLKKVIGVTAPV